MTTPTLPPDGGREGEIVVERERAAPDALAVASLDPRGLFKRRLFAGSVDILLAGGLGLLAIRLLFSEAWLAVHPGLAGAIVVDVALVYYWLPEGLWGATPGKGLAGLRVVDDAGGVPGLGRSVVRTLLRLIEINPILVGGLPAALVAARSRTGRRLGDMLAGTVVLDRGDAAKLRDPGSAADP